MEIFSNFLEGIDDVEHRNRTEEVLSWVNKKFPELAPVIKYNQPMFTHHDTFIIAFSIAKNHLAVSPEKKGIIHFSDEISQSGYEFTTHLMKIPWNKAVDYNLLEKMIAFNILDKKEITTFWRKNDN